MTKFNINNIKQYALIKKLRAVFRLLRYWFGHLSTEQVKESKDIAKGSIRMGLYLMLTFTLVFGIWMTFAPIDSASVTSGVVVVSSNKKTIQHLEGGIIKSILVKEGQSVNQNEPLIIMEDTNLRAQLNIHRIQMLGYLIKKQRLIAERDFQQNIEFDLGSFFDLDPNEVKKIIDGEKKQFNVRSRLLKGQLKIYDQKVKQIKDEIKAVEFQRQAVKEQLLLIEEEIESQTRLLKNGYVSQQEVIQLKKQKAELSGQAGAFHATISKLSQTITETNIDRLKFKNQQLNEIIAQLQELQLNISDVEERLKTSKNAVERTVIKSSTPGVVTGLKYHTIGGVIAAGSPIMDIVPQNEELIIQTRVLPQDIDVVYPGLVAKVRLSAFKAKTVPQLTGTVLTVSPDRFIDEVTGQPFYLARIKLFDDELSQLSHISLYPGMPADVFIITGVRTFLHYLMAPVTDTLQRAFKED
ncbi:MAG: HlyD family type I secretion periplasmic adaptor subunit [Candidatus Marinamargulisbacteria bacterium]